MKDRPQEQQKLSQIWIWKQLWQFGTMLVIDQQNLRKITALDVLLTDKFRALSNKTEKQKKLASSSIMLLCLKYNVQMAASLSGGGSTPTTNSD